MNRGELCRGATETSHSLYMIRLTSGIQGTCYCTSLLARSRTVLHLYYTNSDLHVSDLAPVNISVVFGISIRGGISHFFYHTTAKQRKIFEQAISPEEAQGDGRDE